jgi:phytoene dehydrogenase-like protein
VPNSIGFNPLAIIITPDYKVSFRTDLDETIKNLQTTFPDESNNLKNFFYFLMGSDSVSFARIRSWTFKDLLDQHFSNYKLKAILAAPLLGVSGLPPSLLSAFVGTKLFSEFFIDGGYYPENGMQALPDVLVERFKEFGGELRLSCLVKK